MKNRQSSICAEIEEILIAILQGRGRSAELETHFEHIRDCPDCGSIQAMARRAAGDTGGAVPDPGAEYWREFLPRLEARIRTEKVRPFRRTGLRVAVMSIAAALLVALAWMVLRPGERTPETDGLEARLDEILLAAPEQLGPAETILGEILPDEPDLVDWFVPDLDDQEDQFETMESDWVLATAEIEDVQDLVGPEGNGLISELDVEEMRELLRQLQEELKELIEEIPEARWEFRGSEMKEETT